jgi:hypothetical protein
MCMVSSHDLTLKSRLLDAFMIVMMLMMMMMSYNRK